MEEIKFSSKQIANWRRIAQNVYSDYVKRDKLVKKIAELQTELDMVNQMIDIQEYPVKAATGGYSTEQIFTRKVIASEKVDANGRPIKKTVYTFKYPEVPVNNNQTTDIEEHNETIY